MPAAADVSVVFLILVVATTLEYRYLWPRLKADAARARPGARHWAYQRLIIGQWLFSLTSIAIWSARQRSWSTLGLALPRGWPLAVACFIVLAGAALLLFQLRSVGRLTLAQRLKARPTLGSLAFMLPHTRKEHRWFLFLSCTAGFCEELIYRGYLVWFFAPWLGRVGAMSAMVIVFGMSHIYLGRRGAVTAMVTGAAFAATVLATGSLIPAMIVHALIDIGSGTVSYWLLRDYDSPLVTPPAEAHLSLATDA